MYYYLTQAGKHETPQQYNKGGGINEKLFISRDYSGRGEKPFSLTQSHIIKFWDLEEVDDDNEQTLGEWIEQCEVGDKWRRGTEELERLESKFSEGGDVSTKTKTILGVTHNIMREPVDYTSMKQIEFVHPLGIVYSDGEYGYVTDGDIGLRFDIDKLAEIKVNMDKFNN